MRIVSTSDTHNNYPRVPDGDVFVHAGDLTVRGSFEEMYVALKWISNLDHKTKIVIPGNHDGVAEDHKKLFVELCRYFGIFSLIDQELKTDGVKFYGSPWSTKFKDWWFQKKDIELHKFWNKIPADTDVLVTHTPPYGILDKNRDYTMCGSQTLLHRVREIKPKVHIFGHIHEGYGMIPYGDTVFYNVSYPPVGWERDINEPVVIDL